MSVVFTLYDALVSIKVPDDKAKAVIDAMERDLFAQLVTRSEFLAEMKFVRQEFSSRFDLMSKDIQAIEFKLTAVESGIAPRIQASLAEFENRMTANMVKAMAGIVGVATALIGAMQYFLR